MGTIIDIAGGNTITDWNEVVNAGVSDAIIRLSLGFGDKDVKADQFSNAAQQAGISVSYYHLAYPDKDNGTPEEDAKSEANYFTSLFQANLMPPPKWLFVDLEVKSNGSDTTLSKDEFLRWVNTFLSEVNAVTQMTCMIYSGQPYLDLHLPTGHNLGGIPLWISNYNNVQTPKLPKGWNSYFLWQYTETGSITGISGNCDISIPNNTNLDLEKSELE